MFKRSIALLICFCLIFEQAGFAEVAPQLVVPGYLSCLAPAADRFRPVQLRSIDIDRSTNDLQLILDKGDGKNVSRDQLTTTSNKVFEYFRIGLALPNSTFWVNLRPDSPNNIIDPYLEKTDLGKVLLEADLQLKKDLARFTHPDSPEGRKYWNKLYSKAEQVYGLEDIEIPTVTRPWIVPGEIIIRETKTGAFIYKATLKVCLEQDWLSAANGATAGPDKGAGGQAGGSLEDARIQELNAYSSQLIRELIIPNLTREVNSSKRYAQLRQAYYSLILAQWFKRTSLAEKIDSTDLNGLTSKAPWSKDTYYQAYCKSVQQGEYNKEERVNTPGGITIRQYFSGGMILDSSAAASAGDILVIPAQEALPAGVTDFFLKTERSFSRASSY